MKQSKMADPSMPSNSKLRDFFEEQLEDIYWAEKKLIDVLSKLENAATSNQLKEAFHTHLDQTQTHISRLENIFDQMNKKAKASKCPAIVGIVEEGEDIMKDTEKGTSQRDVGLIMAAQKAEHYEIATYGGLRQLARTMGYNNIADILDETLTEEKETDALLTDIAEKQVNKKASLEPSHA